ncbi:U4/U6.U5 tri-snRNP-associated protein 1-like [Apostichopus japonicus]|uniref:U4/U6.U5 tri-snRNP-associated protein 1-like n=1 Tax=Stichopus japonicus TaxID=307972 RepID=UPI003AB424FD
MGSSKKHKDKDRDEKKHKHRDRDKDSKDSKDRKHHKHKRRRSRSKERDGEKKRRRETDSPILLSKSPVTEIKSDITVQNESQGRAAPAVEGKFHESLSVEETNKIRIKLGLAPLKQESASAGKETSYDDRPDVHKPAVNLATKKETAKIQDKLAMIREKRRLHKKLQKVKTLAEDDDPELEDASAWVKKSRQSQKEREKAEKQEKLLQEMDEEFGISDLLDDELKREKSEAYSAKDMAGIKVEHDTKDFRDGSKVILTLKDADVLNDDGDVLVNYNMLDFEKAKKNTELKKKMPGYVAYDDTEEDEFGVIRPKALLSKYDEEIDGERKKSFLLDKYGAVDTRADRMTVNIKDSLKAQAISLETGPLTLASEFYTSKEMDSFKKPKKKKRRLKKKNLVDELVAMQSQPRKKHDHGSRSRRPDVEEGEINEEEAAKAAVASATKTAAAAANSNSQVTDMEVDLPNADEGKIKGPEIMEDEWGPPIEDEAEKELQNVLNKARKLKQKKERKKCTVEEQVAAVVANIKEEPSVKIEDQTDTKTGSIVLHSTSEFCRALGDIPTYGASGNRNEDAEDDMDIERDDEEIRAEVMDDVKGWNQVNPDEEDENKEEDVGPVLEEEPDIRPGCMGALSLAVKKGYLGVEDPKNLGTVSSKNQHMEAQNYIVEDKNYNDIDAKYNKHDRGYRGPVQDFKDKDGYKPDFKLTYIDESGRELNQKEAFRHLSHRFHGKGSGKLKTEKRLKKVLEEEAMKKMSSTDTPLHTVARMQEKQREMQTPYIVLSGGGKNLTTNPITK